MNCNEAIEYIHSLEKFGMKPGLERIKALCALLGNPQDGLKIIHVAGTNGKGSASTMLSNILHSAGYSVGLFTSPYVIDFRERIQYNGNMIEHYELGQTVSAVKAAIDTLNASGVEPTEFEAITAAAFLYFAKKRCDFVVLEVGLGGRYDSTNIVKAPYASVIMSISMDHTAILGDTIAKIAAEKCGIIKFGGTTVCYPVQADEAMQVVKSTCKSMQNELIIPSLDDMEIKSRSILGTVARYKDVEFTIPLAGDHMVKNACTAIEAVRALSKLGVVADNSAIARGISISSMPARLEVLKKKPLVVLDGGHNEGCAGALADFIRLYLPGKRIIAVCAMMADKDYNAYLGLVAPLVDSFIATTLDMPRALGAAELMKAASKHCKSCYHVDLPHKALVSAHNIAEADDVLLVCGSFYLAAELRDDLLNF